MPVLKKYIKQVLYILLLVCATKNTLFSQPNLYRFQHLSIDDGLSQNSVGALAQDHFGFIWMGTRNGLNRYDGYTFKTFFYDENDSTSISNNQIKALFEDSKGRLWIGTEGGGLNLFNHASQSFTRHLSIPNNASTISSNDINVIFEDLNGTLWVGTREGLNRFIETTGDFKQYKYKADGINCLSNNLVTSIHSTSKEFIWIGTHGGGLNKLDLSTETFTVYNKEQGHTLNDNSVWSVYDDTTGKVWVGTEKGALNVLNKKTGEWRYYGYFENNLNSMGENLVRNIVPGLNGDIWIGSDGGGVYQLNHGENGFFREYRQNIYLPESPGSNSISALFKDKTDVLWVGSVDAGVDRVNLKQKPFYYLSHIPNDMSTLSNNRINCIYQDTDGLYWIGTEAGLNLGDKDLKKFEYFFEEPNNPKTINSNVPLTIYEAKNGEIWIGTYLGGINIYNKKTKTFTYLTHNDKDANSLPSNFVRSIYEDQQGDFWIGTIRGGLSSYNPATKKFRNFSFSENLVGNANSDFIMKVIGDKANTIYVATYGGGLKILNKNTGEIKTVDQQLNSQKGLTDNQVIALEFDADSILWIGTTHGLNKMNVKTLAIEKFYKTDGLPDNFIYGLAIDKNKDLWISTNYGLSRLVSKTGKFENFYKEDGLQSNEFNFNAAYANNSGILFFGGIKGLYYFNPDEIVNDEEPLEVILTGFFINNNEVIVGEKYNNKVILEKPIYQTTEINLSYKQNNFTLNFSTLDFSYKSKIKYRYKIGDNNAEFVELGSRNFISFHNQRPGVHKLFIEASVSNFATPGKLTLLTLNIEPPFYKTAVFQIITGISIILLVIVVYYLRMYRIRMQKKELERIVFEKTNDLQEVNTMLEENQAELEMQHEELMSQRDLTEEQNKKIHTQNLELKEHRINLEKLVNERTEELNKAKLRAENADALKTSFLANMSHEIRTPMNAILGFLEILDDPIYSETERRLFKSLINSSGQTLLNLINDIIDIAKIESGQVDIHKVEFDICTIFKELELFYSKKIKDENSNLDLTLHIQEPVILHSDDLRVRQVLVNLLENAIKFTEKGVIQFGYSLAADHIVCYVKDTGIGMPEDAQNYIFERFIKLDDANGKLYRGTGLGLAISKNIVDLLGGKIWVESKQGVGSNFYFTLPLTRIEL